MGATAIAFAEFRGSGLTQSNNAPQGYLDLLAAIIRSAIQDEGIEYLLTPDGQALCWVGGLDPEVVRTYAVREAQEKQSLSAGMKYRHVHHAPGLRGKNPSCRRNAAPSVDGRARQRRPGSNRAPAALIEKEGE